MRLMLFCQTFKTIAKFFKGDMPKSRPDFFGLATHRFETLIVRFLCCQKHQVISRPSFDKTFAMADELADIDASSHLGFDNNVNRLLKYAAIWNRSFRTHLLLKADAKRNFIFSQQFVQHLLQPVGSVLMDLREQMKSGVSNNIFPIRVAREVGNMCHDAAVFPKMAVSVNAPRAADRREPFPAIRAGGKTGRPGAGGAAESSPR